MGACRRKNAVKHLTPMTKVPAMANDDFETLLTALLGFLELFTGLGTVLLTAITGLQNAWDGFQAIKFPNP